MIDYGLIDKSIFYYENIGYKRIESPWTVTPYISSITKPKDGYDFKIEDKNKVLVASGEQSFLYLYLKGFLPKGKFQTITPCFRNEVFDFTHTKYFIKNELIITDDISKHSLDKIVTNAFDFFKTILPDNKNLNIIKINNNEFDIEYNDIELGSYGYRECDFLKWIYGTGLAEPRLSLLINKIQNGIS